MFAGTLFLALFFAGRLTAQTNIATQHYDTSRSGANTNETILTPANVNSATFGKLFRYSVDAQVYAEPLYVAGVTMGAGTSQAGTVHNVVFVATENDSIFAFDADSVSGANAAPLWQITLLDVAHGAPAGATAVPNGDVSTADINPLIGITGTPVIDLTSNTMYVVGKTLEGTAFVQRLHALDITTGAEKFSGPVALSGQVNGTGNGSTGGILKWDPKWENQRPGLLLLNGIVYIGFAAHGDNGPWHGWLLAYAASTLTQTGVWCTSPNGIGSGIWMSGSGLAADVPATSPYGRMFVATGNGDYTATVPYTNAMDYGDSIVRLDLTNGVPKVSDEFTPYNQASLNSSDSDVASGGVLLLPDQTSGGHTHELVQVGKDGKIHLVDRDAPGEYSTTTDNIVQEIPNQTGGLWSMPAYWNGNVYFGGSSNSIKAFSVTAGQLSLTPTSSSAVSFGYPGTTPVVSSNGTTNGIVWGVQSGSYNSGGAAILYALNATNVATQLYASNQYAGDQAGPAVKFVVPTVINGKVYLGTAGEVDVYGLGTRAATPVITPASQAFSGSLSVNITDGTTGAIIYYTLDGSTPTTSSAVYSGSLTISSTETVTAIAMISGGTSFASGAASQTYTLNSQTPAPTFLPNGGSYATAQSVALSDSASGATIYYTVDGSTPTTNSPVYSSATPINVSATTTIKAIAVAGALTTSPVASATYTITSGGTAINYSNGFSSAASTMTFNGSTDLDDTRLQLTNGNTNEAGSAFVNIPIGIQTFTTDFAFQLSNPSADGFTFTIQGNSPTALGPDGGGLGYGPSSPGGTGGIPNSLAVKFDLYNNAGEGVNSTGLYLNGASPTIPATDLTASGINLHSGDTMAVHMNYNGTNLAMTITDAVANATFSIAWPVNIPVAVGGNTAYVGFTGGTGGLTSSQKVETWTFVGSGPVLPVTATPVLSLASGTYLGTQMVTISDATSGAVIYYTTNGTTPTNLSTQYSTGIAVTASETLTAIALASNSSPSVTTSAAYVIESQVAAPMFSEPGGTYNTAQTVSLSDALGSAAAIYYTTNGATPTTSSTPYQGQITVSASETIQAIAAASGYFPSSVSSATYTITPPAPTPVITPPTGTYPAPQLVTITDGLSGATIYYTTDGTSPTTSSAKYSSAFTINATTTIHAMAIASGYSMSAVSTSTITIAGISYANGFSNAGLVLNGSAAINGTRLRLTNGTVSEAASAWSIAPVNVQTFTNDFTFQLTTPNADGFMFVIQNTGTAALGTDGGSLGYAKAIGKSVGVKFDLYNNSGEGTNSTGLYLNGAAPTVPAVTLGGGVSLHSGDILKVHMTYNGTTLAMNITDTANTALSFTTTWTVNIPSTVGGNTAYVGFTAGTGGATATQDIVTWSYNNTITNPPNVPTIYQTATLPAVSSGPTFRTFTYTGFPDTTGTILDATKVGDNVTFTVNVATAGTYDVKVSYKAYNMRGIWQMTVNGSNAGPVVDEYLATDAYAVADLGNINFAAAGSYAVRFTVTGRNSSSSGYSICWDDFILTPQ
jgi:hypothetical protein